MSFWENLKLVCICIGTAVLLLLGIIAIGFIIAALALYFPWWLTAPVGIVGLIFLVTAVITWIQTWY